MSRITQNSIDRIFETARIEEVIGDLTMRKRHHLWLARQSKSLKISVPAKVAV